MGVKVKGLDGQIHELPDGSTEDDVMRYFGQPNQGMPQPGQRTPTAGAVMPGSQTFPKYHNDTDWENVLAAKIIGGPRAAATALEQAPGLVGQREYAKKIAGNQANLEERQRAGLDILPGIDALRDMVQKAKDEDWKYAAGPYNAQKQPASNEVWLSPSAWRAPEMTPTQARASYGWNSNNPEYQRQWKLQNDMEHLVGALTDQYVASAGKVAAGSDARMELFKDLMKRMMFAPTKEDAMHILETAEASARNTFHLPARAKESAKGESRQADPGSRDNPIDVKDPASARLYRSGTYIRLPDGSIGRVP